GNIDSITEYVIGRNQHRTVMKPDPDCDLALLDGLFGLHPRMHFACRDHRRVSLLECAQRAITYRLDDASAVFDDDRLEDVQVLMDFAESSGVSQRFVQAHAIADIDEQDR
ncbi:MAG TPA: hypothetical protein VGO84_09695, partial [Burkholderiales bacterium]|nr:hypothetical protein [Burkholderiales bacterium]